MASKVAICNMALGALGIADQIANLDTERSAEARACKLFYTETLKELLRLFPWTFATKTVALAEVEETPNDEWAFSYRRPIDCLMPRRILSGLRTDTRDSRVPFKEASDDGGLLIYCDQDEAELEYTGTVDDSERFPADFVAAFAYLLGVRIAPMVTAGDPFGIMQKVQKLHELYLARAMANSANEEQPDVEPDPETIRVR